MCDESGRIWKEVAVVGLKKNLHCHWVSKVFEGDGHNTGVIHLISSVVLYGCSSCTCDVHCTY